MSDTTSELRHALRRLRRAPAFTTAAVLTLALGFGANTAIFTVVEGVILRPLPYPDADRLIMVDHVAPGINVPGSLGLSQGLYEYYRHRARTFTALAIYRGRQWTLTGEGEARRLTGVAATASLDDALAVAPLKGRWFSEQEAQDGAAVVVISHDLWATRFGQDPAILGRRIRLDGTPREVIGVMPATFAFPDPEAQLYLPERIDERQAQTVGGFNYRSIARLARGADVADAEREMNALIAVIKTAFPGDPVAQEALDAARLGGRPEPLKDHVVGAVRRTLWVLLGMVGLVLLIACANVANLFLVRSEARQREIAVRRALGAGRSGVVRYFLAESALLCCAGGALGLALAWAAVRALVRFGPDNLPRLHEVALGAGSAAWTAVLALLATILFGALPLLRRGGALAPALREGGRGSTAGRTRFRVRNALMGAQVALALVLLVGSGLMVRSFNRLRAVDPGFDARNVLTFNVALTAARYPGPLEAVGFHQTLLDRIRALPGVESAGAATCLPLSGSCWGDPLQVRGRPVRPGELPPIAQIRRALPGFLETLRIRVVAGRALEPADHLRRTNAAVVSESFARAYFPGEDALGRQVAPMFAPDGSGTVPDSAWYTIAGIIEDTPTERLGETPFPTIYFPAVDRILNSGSGVHGMTYALRSSGDPLSLIGAVRAAAAAVDADVALGSVGSMEQKVSDATARMAFTMVLLVIAGAVALLLGAIGIYGVIGYIVAQRTGEIGVRMALGARPADVAGMVLRQSAVVVAGGVLLGLAAALGLTRWMAALLFGVTPADPLTYGAVTAFLLGVASLASWLPARRAAALNPTAALRAE